MSRVGGRAPRCSGGTWSPRPGACLPGWRQCQACIRDYPTVTESLSLHQGPPCPNPERGLHQTLPHLHHLSPQDCPLPFTHTTSRTSSAMRPACLPVKDREGLSAHGGRGAGGRSGHS